MTFETSLHDTGKSANHRRARLRTPRRSPRSRGSHSRPRGRIPLLGGGHASSIGWVDPTMDGNARARLLATLRQFDRDGETYGGAVGGARRGPHPAAMAFDDRSADRKSHAEAFGFGREERIEDALPRRPGPVPCRCPRPKPARCPRSAKVEDTISSLVRSVTPLIASMPFMIRFNNTCCN